MVGSHFKTKTNISLEIKYTEQNKHTVKKMGEKSLLHFFTNN